LGRINLYWTGRIQRTPDILVALRLTTLKAISIYSGTKASKNSRWIIRGSIEDANANGTDLEIVARNNDGTNKGTPLMVRRSDMAVFIDKASVIFAGAWDKPIWFGANRVWFDSTGKMRTKATAPTSETDATIIGTQT